MKRLLIGIGFFFSIPASIAVAADSCEAVLNHLLKWSGMKQTIQKPMSVSQIEKSSEGYRTARENLDRSYRITTEENEAIKAFAYETDPVKKTELGKAPLFISGTRASEAYVRAEAKLNAEFHLDNGFLTRLIKMPGGYDNLIYKPFDQITEYREGSSVVQVFRSKGTIVSATAQGVGGKGYFDLQNCQIHQLFLAALGTQPADLDLTPLFCRSLKTLDPLASQEESNNFELMRAISKTGAMFSGMATRRGYEMAKRGCPLHEQFFELPVISKSGRAASDSTVIPGKQ